jgi:maltooligosyltrehalose trehalohydrolase
MPFGAAVLPGGGVRFRLWAPAAQGVDLVLDGHTEQPLRQLVGGWFERNEPTAAAGSRYRFRIDGNLLVPDPASRCNPDDVHGASQVIDPTAFDWQDDGWRGRPWHEAVIYELHVGSFTRAGTFAGVVEHLDHLTDLGVTAIELMPVADFPGRRNWGYDGALPFAPDSGYGAPDDLKRLVQAAHARKLMVFLDVVYNHFGPDGNYLHVYAPDFFNAQRHTPWGAAINFDGPGCAAVREFFTHNALYWLEEFHLDGLRLDAIHAIRDDSAPDIVEALAVAVHAAAGERFVHLILENDRNEAHYLGRDAQWNDDAHHALHVLLTDETDGYYADYADDAIGRLGRCLAQGFAYQGEPSVFRNSEPRGEPSAHLPPGAFIDFLQTHDQVGNRAFGERLDTLAPGPAIDAALAVLLLSPQVPMLFMGEEFAAAQPFLYFCDFAANPELAHAVTAGRRREFARFARFADAAARSRIPDPNDEATFLACVLDWSCLERAPQRARLGLVRALLDARRRWLLPRLRAHQGALPAEFETFGGRGLAVRWHLGSGEILHLHANLGTVMLAAPPLPAAASSVFRQPDTPVVGSLPPWSAIWSLSKAT